MSLPSWLSALLISCLFVTSTLCRSLQVETDKGPIVGSRDKQIGNAFWKGIPYAKAPVGSLRWTSPQDHETWDEPLEANQFAGTCLQLDPYGVIPVIRKASEDCLYLNIWIPDDTISNTTTYPVMVWIHGGAFLIGSASDIMYDGAKLAKDGRVVVVSINYRLGAFGFLTHEALLHENPHSINFGIQDCIAALKWIQKNIRQFGGDSTRVTVFGESAGAIITSILPMLSDTPGLFHRIIAQSPADLDPLTRSTALRQGHLYADAIGCNEGTSTEILQCMREVPARRANLALWDNNKRLMMFHVRKDNVTAEWLPIRDGSFLRDRPLALLRESGIHPGIDVMIGFNKDEANMFTRISLLFYQHISDEFFEQILNVSFIPTSLQELKQLYDVKNRGTTLETLNDVITDLAFVRYVKQYADTVVNRKGGHRVYMYQFSEAPDSPLLKMSLNATHIEEVNFIFRNLPLSEDKLSRDMVQYWAAFAHTGNPNAWVNGQKPPVEWPEYHQPERRAINFEESEISVVENVRKEQVEFWQKHYPDGIDVVTQTFWDHEPLPSYLLNHRIKQVIFRTVGILIALGPFYSICLVAIICAAVVWICKSCCCGKRASKKKQE